MIKDTLLISALVISLVLLYRIYIQSQKINNLEEKFNILDNFTQTMFKYIVTNESNESKEKENMITYSNNDNKMNVTLNNDTPIEMNTKDSEKESEFHEYNAQEHAQENLLEKNENQDNLIHEISENYESKEIISEMVSQLKESLIQNNKNIIEQEINDVEELKQELKQQAKQEVTQQSRQDSEQESSEPNKDDLEELLNNTTIQARSKGNLKKKEEDLMKMKLNDIKALAKNHNISLIQANKPKKKEVLIQNLLSL